MIHILFLILKIIGWILLFLLVILLLLILTILFYPVRYRFSAKGKNTLDTLVAYGKVSWLFHLISGSASYEHGSFVLPGRNLTVQKRNKRKRQRSRRFLNRWKKNLWKVRRRRK